MEEQLAGRSTKDIQGYVVFARSPIHTLPGWIRALWVNGENL
jgi:hypothetical protein